MVTACGGDVPPPVSAPADDDDWSGAVVVHSREHLDAAPRLEMVEQLRLGSLEGPTETQFFQVNSADIAGGELFVLDTGHREVRVFDLATGAHLRTIGGAGEGPGEFQSPTTLEVYGDTLVVLGPNRVSRFQLDGTFLDSTTGFIREDEGPRLRVAMAGRVWYVTSGSRTGTPPPDVISRDTIGVRATRPFEDAVGDELFAYAGRPMFYDTEGGVIHYPMFSAFPVLHGGSDGRLYFTPNDEYRVDVIDAATGEQVLRVRSTMELPPVTQDMIDAEIRSDEQALRDAEERGSSELRFYEASLRRHDLPVAERRTLTNGIRAAADGRWAIIRGDLDPDPTKLGDPARWDVFGPDGEILGHFVTAPGANIRRFTGEYVIARETDEMDVQSVVVYRLER